MAARERIAARRLGHALGIVQDVLDGGGARRQVHHADADVGPDLDPVPRRRRQLHRPAQAARHPQAQRAQPGRRLDRFHQRHEAAVVVAAHQVDDAHLALDAAGHADEHLVDARAPACASDALDIEHHDGQHGAIVARVAAPALRPDQLVHQAGARCAAGSRDRIARACRGPIRVRLSWRSRRHSTKPVKPLHSAAHKAMTPCNARLSPGSFMAIAYSPAMAGSVSRQPDRHDRRQAIAQAPGPRREPQRQDTAEQRNGGRRRQLLCRGKCQARQARQWQQQRRARKAADMMRSRCAALSQLRIHKSDKPDTDGSGQHLRQLHQLPGSMPGTACRPTPLRISTSRKTAVW